ncbi:MAG TPA: hypothetical protein VN213_12370 [Solirubrobacteraceae bacterium]|nr:hypothetical protein [Solirubrobacteraceae bacterium]
MPTGYAFDPRVLAHEQPVASLEIAGRPFALGTADVAQAVLTGQAHELVERSALAGRLERIPAGPAPESVLLAVHSGEYLARLRAAGAGAPCDGEYAPVTPATCGAATLRAGGVLAAVDDDATVRAARAPADDRVRDALAAVRRIHARWFAWPRGAAAHAYHRPS